jgi:Flp pilus assembly protein TadG
MRLPFPKRARRGASAVEFAIVVPVLLVLVLGTIDLGMAVSRYNTVSQAARYGARQVAVHGSTSPVAGSTDTNWTTAWGAATVDQLANATGCREVTAVQPMLVNCPLDRTWVKVEWLDGTNAVGDRARVTVTSTYQPLITSLFGSTPITLKASSTMLISH